MVQILQRREDPSVRIGQQLGGIVQSGFEGYEKGKDLKRKEQDSSMLESQYGIKLSTNPEIAKLQVAAAEKGRQKQLQFDQDMKLMNPQNNTHIDTDQQNQNDYFPQIDVPEIESQKKSQKTLPYTDQQIQIMALRDPQKARIMQSQNERVTNENYRNEKMGQERFESERKYHSDYSKKAEEEVESIRNNISKKEMSLNLSRDAVESDEVGAFSLANLAQRLNIPEWQTMKGAQLETAIKENLLSNMSRVSARGQNIWFEKRLNSMMAQIGKSKEANLAAQEVLEGEVAMDRAYINNFDRLADEDMKKYGFVRKDISKRAHDAAKHDEKEIFKRTSYRLKELEEQEMGLQNLKGQVGKNVENGKPLTMAMAKLYVEKYGDNAMTVAKKNGYFIPTLEEFRAFRANPQEFREEL